MLPTLCCLGHRCDHCPTCLSGACCGEEVGQADLPAQGSWPGPLFAPLGELVEIDGKVVCHICGWKGIALTHHLWHRHKGVTADDYRAYFGLACTRSLLSEAERLRRSQAAKEQGLGDRRIAERQPTPEQMSVIATNREARIEVARKRRKQLTPEFGQAGGEHPTRQGHGPPSGAWRTEPWQLSP